MHAPVMVASPQNNFYHRYSFPKPRFDSKQNKQPGGMDSLLQIRIFSSEAGPIARSIAHFRCTVRDAPALKKANLNEGEP
jgi:hypothetical protein